MDQSGKMENEWPVAVIEHKKNKTPYFPKIKQTGSYNFGYLCRISRAKVSFKIRIPA